MDLLVVLVGVDVGEPALAAVLSVEVGGHEDAGAALLGGALPAKTMDLAVVVHAVVLEDGQLHLLVLMLDLLRALLAATAQAEHQVKGRLLLDVVVGEGPAVL